MLTNFTVIRNTKTMRKLIIALGALIIAGSAVAQKPKINKANQLRESGDLAGAKEIIDQAAEYEKIKDNGKTWYYRGLIYATIDTTSNAEANKLAPNAMEEAMKSFNKAKELGEASSYYVNNEMGLPVFLNQQLEGYYGYYYNMGAGAWNDEDYPLAVESFSNAAYIFPEDTNAVINAAFAAHNGELFDDAIKYYGSAIKKGATSTDLYYSYINLLMTVKKDLDAALVVVKEARKLYPNDGNLAKNEINILIQQEKIDEAKTNLLAEIENEPNNPNLYFTLGVLYEQLENTTEAAAAYKKGIEADPKHYECNYNYGVILINDANEISKERNSLGISKADMKRDAQLEPIETEKLKAALPQWERIYELNSDDQPTMETLLYLYRRLRMNDKAEAISEKLGQ